MTKQLLVCLAVFLLSAGVAAAGEDYFVVGLMKPVDAGSMRSAGLLFLSELDREYLAMGNEPALLRLQASGARFRRLLEFEPGENLYLITARNLTDEMLYSGVLTDLGGGKYLAKAGNADIESLRLFPFAKQRLLPRVFPRTRRLREVKGPRDVVPRADIGTMVARVSEDSLTAVISELSGKAAVMIGGTLDTLHTRYSYSPKMERAAEYLFQRLESYGIDAAYHNYSICVHDFFGVDFMGEDYGWVAGSNQRIFKTTDGGLTWAGQEPGASSLIFNGVCFLDTLEGWASATNGRIYHTSDGGGSWTRQDTPTTAALREICFLDSAEGWVVGYTGLALHTTDGGRNWSSVPTGVTADLYGLHFEAADRGWACGRNGVMLFWDGMSWSSQTSGSSEYLLDVYFVDAYTGYAVGGGSTILKTVDGGLTWVEQSAPEGSNPYLNSVCFADPLKGWAVGLGGTVLSTSDGGAVWTEQRTYTPYGLRGVEFIDDREGWAVGYGGTILHTEDGGLNWENQRSDLPPEALVSWKNVVGTKEGSSSGGQVVICGHFDSVSDDPYNRAPGADDNASGTAAVLEAARVLGPQVFEKTIKFLCFSGEEQGLYGSSEYAFMAAAGGDDIVGVLNFDMIGYEKAAPLDIDLIGNEASEWLVDFTIDCAGAYVPSLPTLKIIDATAVASDHSSFWSAGYDALLGTEDRAVQYPYYHTVNDTLGNLSMPFAADVTRLGIAAVAELAVPDSTASVPGGDAASGATLSACPNPSSGSVRVVFSLARPSLVEAGIYDVRGRLVKLLRRSRLRAGDHELTWDGRDSRQAGVSPGVYFARLDVDGRTVLAKVIVLR
jgi:photosystem II stability/assembly factor-like uncharacterized protein